MRFCLIVLNDATDKQAMTWENIPSDMCTKRALKSACASSQSDQSLRCPHEETLHPWLSKLRMVKVLIRLRECADWSESSLGAYVQRLFSDAAAQINLHSRIKISPSNYSLAQYLTISLILFPFKCILSAEVSINIRVIILIFIYLHVSYMCVTMTKSVVRTAHVQTRRCTCTI